MNEAARPPRFDGRIPSLSVCAFIEHDDSAQLERVTATLARAAERAISERRVSTVDLVFALVAPAPSLGEDGLDGLRSGATRAIRDITSSRFDTREGFGSALLSLAPAHDLLLLLCPSALLPEDVLSVLASRFDDPTVGLVEARRIPLEDVKRPDDTTALASRVSPDCVLLARDAIEAAGDGPGTVRSVGADLAELASRIRVRGFRVEYDASVVVFVDERLAMDAAATPTTSARVCDETADRTSDAHANVPPFAPHTHLAAGGILANRGTSLGAVLADCADRAPPFVARDTESICVTPTRVPFLTIVTRTQGRRLEPLRDVLLCLSGQTCVDFEHIIVGHKASSAELGAVAEVLAALPADQRARTHLIALTDGESRAAPLNAALARARGDYFAVLDDDDLVFAHWVETFATLARGGERGRVLRTVCVEQAVAPTGSSGNGVAACGPLANAYPSDYDVYLHLRRNRTPLMCLAFPLALHREFGMAFDETLRVCEDWDFQMRAVLLVGVASSPEITAIYRRWQTGESSSTLHDRNVWLTDISEVARRLDAIPRVFPSGTIARHLGLEDRVARLETELEERRAVSVDDFMFRARERAARLRKRILGLARGLGKRRRR